MAHAFLFYISNMKKFEFIEHTADVGIKAYGKSLPELFQNSAEAMFSLLLESKPKKNSNKNIVIEAVSLEELLVVWLNELLSLLYVDKFLPASFSSKIEDKSSLKSLTAIVCGQEFDPYANKLNTEIKAATYHDLKVKKAYDYYWARIIFDI